MTKYRQISHVIFDMDGVLLDTEPLYTKAIQNVVGRYAKTFTWEIKAQMMGVHRVEGAKFIIKELDLPLTWQEYDALVQEEYDIVFPDTEMISDTEGVYRNAIATIAKKFGKIYTPDIVAKVTGTPERESMRIAVTEMKIPVSIDEFQKEFSVLAYTRFTKHPVNFIPGAKQLVHHLANNKIPIAVATSSSQDSYNIKTRKHQDIFKLFDHIVCGGSDPEVKHGKPSPDIFLIAASRFLNKPNPDACLVIEDAPNGVKAALNAGMQVVMLPDENIPMELRKDATLVTTSMDKIPLEKFGLPPMK